MSTFLIAPFLRSIKTGHWLRVVHGMYRHAFFDLSKGSHLQGVLISGTKSPSDSILSEGN